MLFVKSKNDAEVGLALIGFIRGLKLRTTVERIAIGLDALCRTRRRVAEFGTHAKMI
jgi:hypothetical protein